VQLAQPVLDLLRRGDPGQVHDQRRHLGPQEVVRAGRAQLGQRAQLLPGQEVEHDVAVGEVADLAGVGGDEPAQRREDRGRLGPPLGRRQRLVARYDAAERLGPAVLGQEPLRGPDDLQRVGLALGAGGAPGGDAVAAEDHPDRVRLLPADRRDVQAELEPGPPPRRPDHPVAEALRGQRFAVRRRRQRDPRVRVQVVDVRGVDQPVHGRVDRRGRATASVPAVVERGDHLVLALHPRVDLDQGPQPVQPQHRQPRFGERAQVTAGTLDPEQLDRAAGDRVGRGALGRCVATGVVGVARVGPEPVAARQQLVHSGHSVRHQAPHPAWVPPIRSDRIRSA
jgi:hypothetical protein